MSSTTTDTVYDPQNTNRRILEFLRVHADATVADIANHFRVTSQAVGLRIAELEAAGYVTRRRCPDDARKTRVNLTRQSFALFHL